MTIGDLRISNAKLSQLFLGDGNEATSFENMTRSLKTVANVTIRPASNGDGYNIHFSQNARLKDKLTGALNKVGGVIVDTPKYIAAAGIGIGCGALAVGGYVKTGATAAAGGLAKGGRYLYGKLKASPAAIKKALTTYPGRIGGKLKSGFRIAWGAIKQGAGKVGNAALRASDATRGAVSSGLFKLAANIEPKSTSSLTRQESFASGEYVQGDL